MSYRQAGLLNEDREVAILERPTKGDDMKRFANLIVMAGLTGGCVLLAQPAASHIAESKQTYAGVKNNLQKMAEQMPEENYSSMASREQKSVGAASKTAKSDLVTALKDSS